MRERCERTWELDAVRSRMLSPIDVASFERHKRLCSVCASLGARLERLRRLCEALPPPPAEDEVRVRRLRGAILRTAALAGSDCPRPRPVLLMASVGAAGSLILVGALAVLPTPRAALVACGTPTAASSYGTGARSFARSATTGNHEGSTERAPLDEGGLALDVPSRAADCRFIVDLPDGEIEVVGTRFDVVVRDGKTESVRVLEGRVALTRGGEPPLVMTAGDSWVRPNCPASAAP